MKKESRTRYKEPETLSGSDLMQDVLSRPRSSTPETEELEPEKIDGIVLGTLEDFDEDDRPMVTYRDMPGKTPLIAVSTTDLNRSHRGAEVALAFVEGDPYRPLIQGVIRTVRQPDGDENPKEVSLDGERLILTADKEVVVRCGKASITLTRAGKIIIKGAYLSNQSSGLNRIKGGSVEIN